MRSFHATLSSFAVFALAGCATLQVQTEYDSEVSLTQLSTYDWVDQEADASGDRNLSTTMGHSSGLIREQSPVWWGSGWAG